MKHRTTASLAAVAMASIALTGCTDDPADNTDAAAETVCEVTSIDQPSAAASPSQEDVKTVDAVKVSGPDGKEPKVEFTTPLQVSAPTFRVISEGSGQELVEGTETHFEFISLSGADGSLLQSSWNTEGPEKFTLGDPQYDLMNDHLEGHKVGTQLVFANVAIDQTISVVLVDVVGAGKVEEKKLTQAQGTSVSPKPGLPTVELANDGQPTVTIPADYKEPTDLVVQPLIEGEGATVTKEQTVTVHYAGCLMNGTSFDSSWSKGAPLSFPLTGVIPGWTNGLAGQKVGSQVLLVVPPELAYQDQERGAIPANSTLIFVVDILDAQTP